VTSSLIEARLHVGAARVDITPADLTELNPIGGGSFSAVHDPIHLRVLVIDDGTTEVALVGMDLVEVGDMRDLRARIDREQGIAADHVAITATHAHNAPRLGDVSPGALAHGGGPEQKVYTAWVYDRAIEAIGAARAARRPARMGIGTGTADVNVNRDVLVDGRWELGENPDGPSDKTVTVLRFDDLDGIPIAVWFNYAVHSTVALWTGLLSGDLAGAAEHWAEDELGVVVALFTGGTLGDQGPRVSLEHATGDARRDRAFAFKAVRDQGAALGMEVVRVARSIDVTRRDVAVHAAERVVPCPTKRGEDVMSDMRQTDDSTVDLRLSLVRLGDVALAGVNGEVVTAIGRRLQDASPLPRTVVVSLVNDRVGYLVDDDAFERNTFEVRGCPVRHGHAERTIVDGLLEMIEASDR
jgi:neutral ceramidase